MTRSHSRLVRAIAATAALTLTLAGCSGGDTNEGGFPWPEQPTSAPSFVPLPTPDGEPTTPTDPDMTAHQISVDRIAAALAGQGIRLTGIRDTDQAPPIQPGVHYIELAAVPEYTFLERGPAHYESLHTIMGTLEPDGSILMRLARSETADSSLSYLDFGRFDDVEHWRQHLDGTRHELEPLWLLPDHPDESYYTECPGYVVTTMDLDEPGQWRLGLHPVDGGTGDIRYLDFAATDPDASGEGAMLDGMDCDSESLLVSSEQPYELRPSGGTPVMLEPGQPILINLTRPIDPYPLADVHLSTMQGEDGIVAQVDEDSGEVWHLDASGDDVPLLSLPGTEHFEWLHMAASEDYLLVALRDPTPTNSGASARAYMVILDLAAAEATVYTRTVLAAPEEALVDAQLGDDLVAINFLNPGLVAGMIVIDLRSDTIVRVGGDASYRRSAPIEVSGDVIAMRIQHDESHPFAGERATALMVHVIGRWNRTR